MSNGWIEDESEGAAPEEPAPGGGRADRSRSGRLHVKKAAKRKAKMKKKKHGGASKRKSKRKK
jgi:hypothetical protein